MRTPDIRIRPYNGTHHDFRGVVTVLDDPAVDLYDARRDTPRNYLHMARTRPGSMQVAVHIHDGAIVGTGMTAHPYPLEGSVAVLPEWRDLGIATAIIDALGLMLEGEGQVFEEIIVNEGNPVVGFWKDPRRGFNETGRGILMERQRRKPRSNPIEAFDTIFEAPSNVDEQHNHKIGFVTNLLGDPPTNEDVTVDMVRVPTQNPRRPSTWGRVRFNNDDRSYQILRTVDETDPDQELVMKGRGLYVVKETKPDTLSVVRVLRHPTFETDDRTDMVIDHMVEDAQLLVSQR